MVYQHSIDTALYVAVPYSSDDSKPNTINAELSVIFWCAVDLVSERSTDGYLKKNNSLPIFRTVEHRQILPKPLATTKPSGL